MFIQTFVEITKYYSTSSCSTAANSGWCYEQPWNNSPSSMSPVWMYGVKKSGLPGSSFSRGSHFRGCFRVCCLNGPALQVAPMSNANTTWSRTRSGDMFWSCDDAWSQFPDWTERVENWNVTDVVNYAIAKWAAETYGNFFIAKAPLLRSLWTVRTDICSDLN